MFGKEIKRDNRVIENALKNLPKYNSRIGNAENFGKTYTYSVEHYEDIIYLKLYYEGEIDWSSTDELFLYSTNALLKINYRFQGITHYRENHEICITFLKKGE